MFNFKDYKEMTDYLRKKYYKAKTLSRLYFVGICGLLVLGSFSFFIGPLILIGFFGNSNIFINIAVSLYMIIISIILSKDLRIIAKILTPREEVRYDFLAKKSSISFIGSIVFIKPLLMKLKDNIAKLDTDRNKTMRIRTRTQDCLRGLTPHIITKLQEDATLMGLTNIEARKEPQFNNHVFPSYEGEVRLSKAATLKADINFLKDYLEQYFEKEITEEDLLKELILYQESLYQR